jgi:hypothetical protein
VKHFQTLTGLLILGLAAQLLCEALHPGLAAAALAVGVLLVAEGRRA